MRVLFLGFSILFIVPFHQKNNNDLELITLSEKLYDYEGDGYCGCWDVETIGEYGLRKGNYYLSLGKLKFCESENMLKKGVCILKIQQSEIYILYQYGTCTSDVAFVYGFDDDQNRFFRYSFVHKNKLVNNVCYTSAPIIIEKDKLRSHFFDSNQEDFYVFWRIDTEKRQFIEL